MTPYSDSLHFLFWHLQVLAIAHKPALLFVDQLKKATVYKLYPKTPEMCFPLLQAPSAWENAQCNLTSLSLAHKHIHSFT